MSSTYGIKLPGFNKKIWVNEITSKVYKDLVKSLYNNDTTEFLQHLSYTIEHVSPGILQGGLNVVDKIILLLHMRAICISPDLNMKAKCTATKKDFDYTVKIEDMLSKLENITYTSTVVYENIQIVHSVVKCKDEMHFVTAKSEEMFTYQLASCIDTITVNNNTLHFKDIEFKERVEMIERLPLTLASKVFDAVVNVEAELSKIKLLVIPSPFADELVLDLPVSTDTKLLLDFCKLIFNDDLINLYKMNLNLVSKAGFTPEYIDSITPAEQLLYWTLYVKQAQKEQSDSEDASKGKPSNSPSFGGNNLSIGRESPSEFTG